MDNVFDHLADRRPEEGSLGSILELLLENGADLTTIDFTFWYVVQRVWLFTIN